MNLVLALAVALSVVNPVNPVNHEEMIQTAVRTGGASWYCWPGVSKCTYGRHWSGAYAAAGPALRVGTWRGRIVRVQAGTRSRLVRLIDFCACPTRLIDLYGSVFDDFAPRSRGVIRVSVTWP